MVRRPSDRGRGQLILIGALVIALLVVGVTIIVNTTLFVENTPSDESAVVIEQATTADETLRDAAVSTTFRVNHQSRNHTWNESRTWARDNVSRLASVMRQQYLQSRSFSVNMSVESTTEGTRVVQAGDGNFSVPPAPPPAPTSEKQNWTAVDGSRIGWFVVNLNGTEGRTGPFHAVVENGSGESVDMTIEQVNKSAYEIDSAVSTGGTTNVTCATRDGRLVLDVRRGRSPTDRSCRFNGTSEIRNASTIEFENGDNAFGKYSIVINGTRSTLASRLDEANAKCDDGSPSPAPTDPCHTPVVWSMQLETTVVGNEITRENERNATVYPGGSGG